MLDWMIKYWVQVLFGLIITTVGICRKKIKNWFDNYIENKCKEEIEEHTQSATKSFDELIKENQKQNEQITYIHDGILALQGASFKHYCKQLLKEDYEITMEDFELCQEEYEAYHELGGNGKGTALYNLVCQKAKHLAG